MIALRHGARPAASPFSLRRASRHYEPLCIGLVALSVFGCALTSKSEPLEPRYYSPERYGAMSKPAPAAAGPAVELRLGHVGAASYLDERMVYRDSDYELGY